MGSPFFISLLSFVGLSWGTQAIGIKPTDYQPIVSTPWEPTGASPDLVVRRIYLEPTHGLRMGLLAGYLGLVPLIDMDHVFDLAMSLEGMERPDDTANLILRIWAERAPEPAWIKTKQLFKRVGVEGSSLGYAGWDHGRIKVVNQEQIQLAGYRLQSNTLIAFPAGVDASDLEGGRKVKFLKLFNEEWYSHFDRWPFSTPHRLGGAASYSRIFDARGESLKHLDGGIRHGPAAQSTYELILRRRLVDDVKQARGLIEEMAQQGFEAGSTQVRSERRDRPSPAFLLLWARADQEDLLKWANEIADSRPEEAWLAKCILMSFVDAETRAKWGRSIIGVDDFEYRIETLAAWEPELAVTLALESSSPHLIGEVLRSAGFGPWDQMCFDTCKHGLNFAQSFDVSRIPKGLHGEALGMGCTMLMEQWGDVDSGQCARFGMRITLLVGDVSRDEMLKTLRGEIMSADDDGVWDRTFCALRMWAIMRPTEMKAWIAKQPEHDMRESLIWLLEHPWGQDR
jgi:hypothetical protein